MGIVEECFERRCSNYLLSLCNWFTPSVDVALVSGPHWWDSSPTILHTISTFDSHMNFHDEWDEMRCW